MISRNVLRGIRSQLRATPSFSSSSGISVRHFATPSKKVPFPKGSVLKRSVSDAILTKKVKKKEKKKRRDEAIQAAETIGEPLADNGKSSEAFSDKMTQLAKTAVAAAAAEEVTRVLADYEKAHKEQLANMGRGHLGTLDKLIPQPEATSRLSDAAEALVSAERDLPSHMSSAPRYDESSRTIVRTDVPRLPLPYVRQVRGLLGPPPNGPALQDLESPTEQRPVANLAHGLDRVLFNPGVHWVQDPHSRVYNYPPYLQKIPKVEEFDFQRVSGFTKSSQDNDMQILAKQEGCKFVGSTSSLTGMLSHIYFALSGMRPVDLSTLSQPFARESRYFSYGQRLPVSVMLRYQDGVYATDSDPRDPSLSQKNVLTWMGTMLEKYLTVSPEEFASFMRDSPAPPPVDDGKRDAYRYAKFGQYVMRSQLDCQDSRLPGTGVFDIKTRAALPIRMDMLNLEENSGYLIRTLHGPVESFEKEYYDLIRSAFLKYGFQARIGNMDGIFVAYHNTAQMFGIQYVPLEEIDARLYGNKEAGPLIFYRCLEVLELVVTEATQQFPGESVSLVWDTDNSHIGHVWVEPANNPEGTRPVVQLDIELTNYIGEVPVKSQTFIDKLPHEPWTVHWAISQSSASQEEIRSKRQSVLDTQTRYWDIPTGMKFEDMQKFWDSIDYGRTGGAPRTVPVLFKEPGTSVKHLRELARAGREESERLARLEAGKRKVVWGEPELYEDEDNEELGKAADCDSEASAEDPEVVAETGVPAVPAQDVSEAEAEVMQAAADEDVAVPEEPVDLEDVAESLAEAEAPVTPQESDATMQEPVATQEPDATVQEPDVTTREPDTISKDGEAPSDVVPEEISEAEAQAKDVMETIQKYQEQAQVVQAR